MKKPLPGCVLCRDCKNKTDPHPLGILSVMDMIKLGYSGCLVNDSNWLVVADRKCSKYEVTK
jgi:hypothetical protein